jgi:hypothetical protein
MKILNSTRRSIQYLSRRRAAIISFNDCENIAAREGTRPTWGLDDTGLVGLGGVAVPLPVCEPLHHIAAAAGSPSSSLCTRAVSFSSEAAGEWSEGQR